MKRGFPCEGACGGASPAILRRPKDGSRQCKPCFFAAFEGEVLATIAAHGLVRPGERIALAVSGGKDSTVLAAVLTKLNREHALGAELVLLSIDEGIRGYRDDSLDAVRRTAAAHADRPPLTVVSYKDLYGWSMDEIVGAVGRRNNCAFCGVFRRQALERGAALVGAHKLATGHNADDVAETVLMNFLRGDIARLGRCTASGGGSSGGGGGSGPISVPRIKPFLHCYEKEIVLYARHAKLDYVSTECKYSPGAYRGFAREFLKDLEATRSSVISDIIFSAQQWEAEEEEGGEAPGAHGDEGGGGGGEALAQAQQAPARACARCGFAASGELCQACLLLAGLAVGRPRLALTKAGATRAEVAAIMAIPSQPARNAEAGGAGPQPG